MLGCFCVQRKLASTTLYKSRFGRSFVGKAALKSSIRAVFFYSDSNNTAHGHLWCCRVKDKTKYQWDKASKKMDREGNELTLPHLILWDSGLNEQSGSARLRCFFFALKSRRLMRKWIMGQPLGQRWESNEEKCIDLRWGWNPGPLENALTSGGDGTQALWKMHWPQVRMETRPLKNALTSGGDGPRPFGIVLWLTLPTNLQRFHSSTNTFNFAIKYSWSIQYHQNIQKHCSTNTHCQSLLVVCQWYVIGTWCIFTTQCQVKVKKKQLSKFSSFSFTVCVHWSAMNIFQVFLILSISVSTVVQSEVSERRQGTDSHRPRGCRLPASLHGQVNADWISCETTWVYLDRKSSCAKCVHFVFLNKSTGDK